MNEEVFWNIIEKNKIDPLGNTVDTIKELLDMFLIYEDKLSQVREHEPFCIKMSKNIYGFVSDDTLDYFEDNCIFRGKDVFDAIINENEKTLLKLIDDNKFDMRGEFYGLFVFNYIKLLLKNNKEIVTQQDFDEKLENALDNCLDEYYDKFYKEFNKYCSKLNK